MKCETCHFRSVCSGVPDDDMDCYMSDDEIEIIMERETEEEILDQVAMEAALDEEVEGYE